MPLAASTANEPQIGWSTVTGSSAPVCLTGMVGCLIWGLEVAGIQKQIGTIDMTASRGMWADLGLKAEACASTVNRASAEYHYWQWLRLVKQQLPSAPL
ncbi:hypothetical protein BO71DRAFT_479303 [Aspergillus ellipticus CBS 707.79]|uniref:Uncharacterized protein n=1 Tax=Aspergillus ellipticus CBS 707.79 TaxID=1448320 RepID=A0A319DPN6_9EURO|nr:hypothetical protein BO71DRAFT_479303 [Aspergillus ellipticus CBS 707.79]